MTFARASAVMLAVCLAAAAQEAKLQVREAAVSDVEGGRPVGAGYRFAPGEYIHLNFRIAGYQRKEDDDERMHTHIVWKVRALDPQGLPLAADASGAFEGELAEQNKNWEPKVHHQILLPPVLASGDYRFVIAVKDEFAGKAIEHPVVYSVRGNAAPAVKLEIRQFRFLASETDPAGRADRNYPAGSSLWARFDIAGYKFTEGNRYDVSYGLEVLNAAGKSLFQQPVAAEERDSSFYPKRQLAGMLSLTISNDMPKARYTLIVRARDQIGGETAESRHEFGVE